MLVPGQDQHPSQVMLRDEVALFSWCVIITTSIAIFRAAVVGFFWTSISYSIMYNSISCGTCILILISSIICINCCILTKEKRVCDEARCLPFKKFTYL